MFTVKFGTCYSVMNTLQTLVSWQMIISESGTRELEFLIAGTLTKLSSTVQHTVVI